MNIPMLVTAGTVATSRLVFSGFDPDEVVDPEDVEPLLLHPAIAASARPAPPASMPRREIAFVVFRPIKSICPIMPLGRHALWRKSRIRRFIPVSRDGISRDTDARSYDLIGVLNRDYFRHAS